jgi:hypothetical protein
MGLWAVSGLARDPVSIDLNSFKWKNRLLFLFASSEEDRFFLALKEEIARQGMEIRDRDLLVFEVFEKGESRLGKERLSSGQVLALRKHLSVPSGQFMIILIGKDGGEKLRQDRLVELEILESASCPCAAGNEEKVEILRFFFSTGPIKEGNDGGANLLR